MKSLRSLITMAVVCVAVVLASASEVDQLKVDLIGQTMGGREKSWKFQSVDQIKELVIKNKTEDLQKRVYTIGLQLQAAGGDKYAAEAKVEYWKTTSGWKIDHVGLLSLKKMD